jgi:hypothetical protein
VAFIFVSPLGTGNRHDHASKPKRFRRVDDFAFGAVVSRQLSRNVSPFTCTTRPTRKPSASSLKANIFLEESVERELAVQPRILAISSATASGCIVILRNNERNVMAEAQTLEDGRVGINSQ